jgi:hypothetical protein
MRSSMKFYVSRVVGLEVPVEGAAGNVAGEPAAGEHGVGFLAVVRIGIAVFFLQDFQGEQKFLVF